MSIINWPDLYLPGKTDFFVSNETIISGVLTDNAWTFLADTRRWHEAYSELSGIEIHDESDPVLSKGTRFSFNISGLTVQAEVTESQAPSPGVAGRLSWHGWVETGGTTIVDAWCAWIIEDLHSERTRILWQESLLGKPAKEMSRQKPNPALLSHQDWVDGIAHAARTATSR
ncbi:SRPBCC domain-containing protein [Pantoea sp. NPDC088449]|uniref:SRPBCC domain-containing protein n=1 Tax=Pantoea sp. NPDC088449 TaxID=3364392 RepID=UPI0037F86548